MSSVRDNRLQTLSVHSSHKEPGGGAQSGVLSTDYRTECAKLKEKNVKVCSFYLEPGARSFYLEPGARRSFEEIANMTEVKSEALSPTEGGKDMFVHESVFLCADPRAARPSLRECVLFVL